MRLCLLQAGAEAQYTGGRHGYGAKLTNIFSNEFSVETVDTRQGLRYFQKWEDNMHTRHEPVIEELAELKLKGRNAEDYTSISFVPDLSRFGMKEMSADMVEILTKRVWEIAGCNPSVAVYLHGKRLKVPNMKRLVQLRTIYPLVACSSRPDFVCMCVMALACSYVKMFVPDVPDSQLKFYSKGGKWDIAVTASSKATGSLSTVSFVNNTSTSRGGTHVSYILDQVSFCYPKIR